MNYFPVYKFLIKINALQVFCWNSALFSIIPKSRRHLSANASDVSGSTRFSSLRYPVLLVQETSVISDRHHGFNLLDRFEDNADNDDQTGAAE